ncbi:unnamed protein product [Spirodela intermedia]|uniref:Uncharacterized protein n=1 Tax=Spirodela intermedia TaxID=51605 RepID=A0ABN7EC45_SPIIN|nr:unnamed protein product [Spirodela intermedia]
MKWVIKLSPAAVTRQSRKTATLGARWRWARVRELHPQVRAARGGSSSHLLSHSSPCSRLTPRLRFRPACGHGWPAGSPIFAIFLFYFLFFIYLKSKTVKII